jgi:hypothetical protein
MGRLAHKLSEVLRKLVRAGFVEVSDAIVASWFDKLTMRLKKKPHPEPVEG